MLPIVKDLLILQDRDQRSRTLGRDLKNIPALIKRAESRLEQDQAAVETAQNGVRQVELKIKNLELDIQTRKTTMTRLKDQQFNTRKNEEFRALGNEYERYAKEVNTLEDQELELMEELESVKPALATAQAGLAVTKASVDAEIAELQERSKALEARLAELLTERRSLVTPIDQPTLNLYDRLLKTKGDAAVVLMEAGICQGCHVRVVSGTVQKLKANQELTQCEQCGRILYLEG